MAPEDSDTDGRDGSGGEDAVDDHDESPDGTREHAHDEDPAEVVDDGHEDTAEDDPFGTPYPDSEREDPFGDPYPDPDREKPGPETEEQPEDASGADNTRTVSDGFGSRPPEADDQQGPASPQQRADAEPAPHRQTESKPAPHRRTDADSHRRGDSEPIQQRRGTAEPEPPRKRSTPPEPSSRRQSASERTRRSDGPGRKTDTGRRSFDGRWSLRNDRSTGRDRSRSDNRSTGRAARPRFGPGADRPSTRRSSTEEHSSLRFERDQQSALYSELHALEETMPDHHVTKPYLERVPDGYDAELAVMEWIEGLITTAGYDATLDALAYYRSIGWISTDVERTLEEHANTIARSTADGDYEFTMQDHRRSLRAIARIAQSGR